MTATETWVDADGPVSGAAMAANNITGAIRYILAGSAGKLITRAEYADLIAHGRQVRFVVERLTTDADAGYGAGVQIARQVPAALAALGAPADSWVYAANDKPAWNQADVDYVRGFRDVLGLGSTGGYGFGAFLAACHTQGVAGSLWQAGPAPSRTGTSSIANFWQRQGGPVAASDGPTSPTTITLAGRVCDLNNRLNQETDMAITDADAQTFLNTVVYTRAAGSVAPGDRRLRDMLVFLEELFLDGGPQGVQPGNLSVVNALTDMVASIGKIPTTPTSIGELTGTADVTVQLAPKPAS